MVAKTAPTFDEIFHPEPIPSSSSSVDMAMAIVDGSEPPRPAIVSPPASPTTTKAQVKVPSTVTVEVKPPPRKKRPYRKSKPSTSRPKRQLPADFQPTSFSVICGRGKECFDSEGNKRFREIINKFLDDYAKAPGKSQKSDIVSKAMNIIREKSPQGAFVKCEKGIWWEVSTRYAREKVGAWFRDCLHSKYKSSSKAKHARKMAKRVSFNNLDPEEIMNFPLDDDEDFDMADLDVRFYEALENRESTDTTSAEPAVAAEEEETGPAATTTPAAADPPAQGEDPPIQRKEQREEKEVIRPDPPTSSDIQVVTEAEESTEEESGMDDNIKKEEEEEEHQEEETPHVSSGSFYDIDDMALSLIPFDADLEED